MTRSRTSASSKALHLGRLEKLGIDAGHLPLRPLKLLAHGLIPIHLRDVVTGHLRNRSFGAGERL